MKTIFYTLSFLFLFSGINAQNRSINFEQISWQEVLSKAAKENKMIFFDAYTSWCGPCKWMAANVFTNDTVADYFNQNFINVKIDMEKEEGINLAKEYKVTSYPTYLFVDSSGTLLHRYSGSAPVADFITIAQDALNPAKRISYFDEKYQNGDRSNEFIREYIDKVSKAGNYEKQRELVDWYFALNTESKLLSKENFEMIEKHIGGCLQKPFIFLLENTDYYYQVAGKERVNKKIMEVYDGNFRGMLYQTENEKGETVEIVSDENIETFRTQINNIKDKELKEKLAALLDAYYYQRIKNWPEYEKAVIKHLQINSLEHWAIYNDYAWTFYENENIKSKEAMEAAITWAQKSVAINSNYYNNDTLAAILYKAGKKKEALRAAKKAIEIGKKTGDNISATEDLLIKINAGK
jgi:thiol-disulfide isomerase/thioredoxin